MSKRIYIKNLPGGTTSRQVSDMFKRFGNIVDLKMSRGGTFYVEMETGADEAIRALHKTQMGENTIFVTDRDTG